MEYKGYYRDTSGVALATVNRWRAALNAEHEAAYPHDYKPLSFEGLLRTEDERHD